MKARSKKKLAEDLLVLERHLWEMGFDWCAEETGTSVSALRFQASHATPPLVVSPAVLSANRQEAAKKRSASLRKKYAKERALKFKRNPRAATLAKLRYELKAAISSGWAFGYGAGE